MATSKRKIKTIPHKFKKQDGGLVEYGWGGTMQTLAPAANLLNLAVPGLGVAVSAGMSVGGAAIQAKEDANAQNKLTGDANLKAMQNQGMLSQANIRNPYQATFAMGGTMMPTAEVEGGEVVQSNSGQIKKIKGPKHSQGGVDLTIPGGGRVFSDRLINPATGNTFADDAAKLMKGIK